MNSLERAIEIAVGAHAGQVDKAGAPYILHPLRVMLKMRSEEERIIAVLHDVIEDSHWTLANLQAEGFSDTVVVALDHLTRRPGEDYDSFIQRATSNHLSARVKLADLEDNTDASRLQALTDRDRDRLAKYRRAMEEIRGSIAKT